MFVQWAFVLDLLKVKNHSWSRTEVGIVFFLFSNFWEVTKERTQYNPLVAKTIGYRKLKKHLQYIKNNNKKYRFLFYFLFFLLAQDSH